MKDPKKLFHIISYLQYPLMVGALIYYVPFLMSLFRKNPDLTLLNYVLILFGVALSFSTLQDTTKTQNTLSKIIWSSPKKGRITLILLAIMAFGLIVTGLIIFFLSHANKYESIALGITVLGIGFIGLLKSAIELFENHRKDKPIKRRHKATSV